MKLQALIEDEYAEHLKTLRLALVHALVAAAEEYPEQADQLYIVGLDVDGQYVEITVGVSNRTNFVIEFEVQT